MSKLIILVFSLFGLFSACVGQIVQTGQCDPNLPLSENFDIEQFLGTWYEVSRSDNPNQQGDCASYELTKNDGEINVYHSSVNKNFYETARGTLSQIDDTAKLSLSISSFDNPIDFWVLLTEYTTFAITFSCENISPSQRKIHLWVLGREKVLGEMVHARIQTLILNSFNIDASTLRSIDHGVDACLVLPVIEPGDPIVLPGQCDPELPLLQNFNVDRFLGLWHQVSSYETPSSQGSCARAEYTMVNGVVNVLNSEVVDQQLLKIDGYASVSSTDNSAKLSVVLNIPGASPTPQELWILASDYDSYAIAYTCTNKGSEEKQVYSWILSRTRQMSTSTQAAVDKVVDSYLDLNYQYYKLTDQSDGGCFFYPEPVLNQPVVFRGQCESVAVQAMQNFEIERYMGLWHNIELYPAPFQVGECSNAFYELVDGTVNVVNTQVINERLDTIKAVAVSASNDGSAKLIVTFPVAGTDLTVSSDYWVLATDYTRYALVYTCSNINPDEMQVGSWKLSKTKQLSLESANAINAALSAVSVLDQRYYETVKQTEESCFYFPEAQPGVPVVFPGQCDDNIDFVENLDFAQFQGTWHEIQAYPKAEQTGQCISHQYSFVDNTRLNLVSSSVTDQFLEVINGVVTSATDNTGRLTISITEDNGEVKTIPLRILSVDYDDYAFAYACVNINQDYRGVWSWKLSRTKQLSAEANRAIANIMETNVVLQNNYFEDIDQSDDACFFLPELEAGEPVILSGQCDVTITGIPNFNITRYTGRWRLIGSYGSDFQVGTCNVARYNLQDDNTLEVTNSQVVNEELASISGTATISSTDGSGQLRFYFPSRNEYFDFTILDTDYDSYALGYGCVNINNDQRRVYSWKLSRENTLSQAAIDKMNEIITSIQVLNNRYYYTVQRTETDCFYFPTPDRSSSVKFRGQCDQTIPVVTDFQPELYLGVWYDTESYPGDFQDGTCNTATYSPGNDVDVFNTQVIDQALFSIRGSAVLEPSSDGSAKLRVTFNLGGVDVTTNYWVLATDYYSYSLVYSCRPVDDEYFQVTAWKLSKTRTLTSEAETAINEVMNTIKVVDQRYFIPRDHTAEGCFYYPEPQPGVPVVFPGQCSDSIAAVPGFNMEAFQGTWHEIEAYPKDNQDGRCINHQYTLSGTNTLDLQSSNVLNLVLRITSSTVEFDSTDGSGRLIISITSDNDSVIKIPLWILSTDYTDYALAYSCVNINSETRAVYSWKLSKSKELSEQASAAINNAMADIDVVDDRYFEDIDQSDQACFHLPDITPGQDVILPGQCDSTIKGIPNFNIERYSGQWRLIESYGSRFQSGKCNIATYTYSDSSTLNVTNSQVVNANLASISGTATISSTDGSGQLVFYFPSRNREYELFILDTDYASYALAYGCVNQQNNQRRVTSWKFSRFNTLTQEATEKINQVMDTIEVLHQPYYYIVDRSEDDCFYFPVADSNTMVRFRGQCDQSIPVVTDFDVGRYLGLWHDIESYPMPFQDGDCPNAYYAPYSSDTVTVYNTQVIDQSLDIINGLATASADGSAKLKVTFSTIPGVSTDYWVLDTDYDSYAFVYSCTNIDDEYMGVTSWKLSRTKELTLNATIAIEERMNDIRVLDERYFVPRDQTPEGCFYFPEPQPGVQVVFPGQCDENIAAEPDFNMEAFQGTWHEIQAYPKDDQPGQCISHQFTLNATNTLRLDSFNVLNQALSSTESDVTFAGTDGSGKLNINIWVDGEAISIPYWILSTDYTNYALAYSCVNIDSDYRGVWSWKLSKTKQLSAADNVAIINAIAKVDVLQEDYYEDIDQTDQACFHLPDIAPGEDVILPGQCDTTIKGIPNFNIERYAGQWRLIESYGSRFQSGKCNIASYTYSDSSTLNVTNSQVVNANLASISGTATISSTDGSGQLVFYFPSRNREYELFILDTDYASYALAYGCVNQQNNQRRVTSWKFSRFNTLTQEATDKINQVMDTIEVLHQPYYYIVDRSEDDCFYFPVADSNTMVRFRGQCDQSIPVVTDFDVGRYLGLWHDIESYPMPFQDGDCPNAYYAPYSSDTVTVYNTQVIDQSLDIINGLATASADGSAKLKVTFSTIPGVSTDYWVLDTDYDSYAFVYSCTNIDDEYMGVTSWKLSRTKELTLNATIAIEERMNDIRVLDERYFVPRDQTPEGCFYFPEPQPGVQVVFPGQCDENIAAVPDFNMEAFQGTWHEIQAYPKDDQPGQCISHQFTLNATNTLRLDSFNVLNQAQSSTESDVTFAGTDGSGKLNINIWVDGEAISIPYWILSTDYTNYALAYSCVNIDSDYRGVWSWKLSKTKQLSTADNVAINNAIANIDVLKEDYYEDIQQTDSACFYFPELGPTDPVVFPGQCDPNIPVMKDFDVSKFLGQWRLIESYYSDFQEGTCITATYSAADDGSVIVYNTKVNDEQLNSITGSAVPLSNDGSGKLVVTFPGSPPVDYWILDTDYESYALIYSCDNISNDQRRVWSWKMSKTDTLSEGAINSIDKIVDSIDVLVASYYQPIDRTPTGCFYYPTPDSTTNVIFPGQCDESISVVPDFKPEQYVGTWYDIESYPTNFQSGTCNTATYALNADGSINVQNTQVVEQVLQTTTGSAVVASTDGSAKLDVTFSLSSGIFTTKYWVLATDYQTYSLVYSCRNIDKESRAVYSWKLSKTKTLTETAETAINNAMKAVQVLDQQYFVHRSHTEESCFYYPDNFGGDVILNGQCVPDAQIPAMTGFNANAFAGTWHEVARFPSALQNGECTATQYALDGDNGFTVIQTTVLDEALLDKTTQATVATDGRGVISINVDGVPFNDVYILDTDYYEYALAYSCRNLDADTKQIYSWKLSRSRTGISDTANNIIDQLVSNNVDLFEAYYQYTSQDDATCFYYPEFDLLPPTIELPGPCNTSITGIENFNAPAYLGTWYEIARYPQTAQSGQCNRANYADLGSGVVSVVNSQVVDERLATITGEAKSASTDGSGLLEVTFVVGGETRVSNYYVLATDYDNYALVYSCANLPNGNRQVGSWKLSRFKTLSTEAHAVMNDVISQTQGLKQNYYQSTSQSDESCFYYPVFDQLPPTIELPGPCNTTINAKPDFSAADYLGTWFDIARYPNIAQSGQCNRADYADLGNGVVSVVNSQVIDTSLATITGEARSASTDGSGLLEVTFVVGGETRVSNYYVLATDYTDYSLVYSCANLPNGNRQVGSWKLSRTKTLSSQALAAMDVVISEIQGLSEDYYQSTSQSDDSCFYYPVQQTGAQVILPGQCDENISVVSSFDVAEFAGNWYWIQSYDATEDSSCKGTRLTYNEESDDFQVIDFEVVNDELLTREGSGRLNSADGSAKFSIVMENSNDTETIIYILGTDYENYALAYSCKNIDSSYRQVGAWQLSRERTMQEASVTAINSIIEDRQELHVPYFKQISQDAECPEPSSAFLFKSSIIVICLCALLQLVW